MKRLFVALLLCAGFLGAMAQQAPKRTDGMWIPLNVEKLNFGDMQATGFEPSSAAAVYDEQNASLKDAIVKLNGGSCTAECISSQGLLLTNHHCAYDGIASLSSVDHDYLTEGFWAMKPGEEQPLPGNTAAFLIHSENVTDRVLKASSQQQEIAKIVDEATKGNTDLEAEVEAMFSGGEYYLFVYEVYRDVRLVGCPPSSIGKFGGDTDNWMWPRHTGDFSLLRVYAGADNKPADYSPNNKPYTPKRSLVISLRGTQENDYAMVMGYPGNTDRYLTASAVTLDLEQKNADRILLLGTKTSIMKKYMDADPATRIALASNYASQMNYYKYLIGQTTMLNRYDIVGVKKAEEIAFQTWSANSGSKPYQTCLQGLNDLYKGHYPTDRFVSYLNFSALGSQAATIGLGFFQIKAAYDGGGEDAMKAAASETAKRLDEQYKDFVPAVDKEIFAELLIHYFLNIPAALHPKVMAEILTHKKAKKGHSPEEKIRLWTDWAYTASFLADKARAKTALEKPSIEQIDGDPIMKVVLGIVGIYRDKIVRDNQTFNKQTDALYRIYIEGMRAMRPERNFYPDANSTMRLTYGKVSPYYPRDGVFYKHFTTLAGVIEKNDPQSDEFNVPAKLQDLYAKKDYGRYGKNGELMVNFLTTNDITGGNSGSPVMNGRGELIGCAFDGNWEAMAGDIYVFPNLNRTICCDIRYILFIIDKYAGCTRLIEELKLAD